MRSMLICRPGIPHGLWYPQDQLLHRRCRPVVLGKRTTVLAVRPYHVGEHVHISHPEASGEPGDMTRWVTGGQSNVCGDPASPSHVSTTGPAAVCPYSCFQARTTGSADQTVPRRPPVDNWRSAKSAPYLNVSALGSGVNVHGR
jgi:hypothetical protein